MKTVSRHQFVDAFKNKGGNFAKRFDGILSPLTIPWPWHVVVHASRMIMIFGVQFDQVRPFTLLFCKMKAQHAHHILCQFASVYYGDSQACSMLFIKCQQAWLDADVADLHAMNPSVASGNLFNQSSFKTKLAQ
jgi:hypothetical protein